MTRLQMSLLVFLSLKWIPTNRTMLNHHWQL